MFRSRNLEIFKVLSYLVFNEPYLVLLAGVYNCYRDSCLVGTTCSTAPVRIDRHIVGKTEIYHVRKVIHIKPACSDIGRYQELRHMVSEFFHCKIPLSLRKVSVQTICIIAIGDEFVGNLLSLLLCAAENYAVDVGTVVNHPFEREIFVMCLDHIIDMPHILRPLVAVSGNEFNSVSHVFSCYLRYFFGHCCRKHQHLAVFRNMRQDFIDIIKEPHVQHLVCLVKYDRVHIVEFHNSSLDQVYKSARSCHYDLNAFAQSADLAFYARTSIHRENLYSVGIFREIREIPSYLKA